MSIKMPIQSMNMRTNKHREVEHVRVHMPLTVDLGKDGHVDEHYAALSINVKNRYCNDIANKSEELIVDLFDEDTNHTMCLTIRFDEKLQRPLVSVYVFPDETTNENMVPVVRVSRNAEAPEPKEED